MEEKKSKISNVEWGLLIGALLTIDTIQILLDLAAQVGVVLNRFIDVFVGMALAFYLQMRGQSMVNPKRLMGLIGTLIAEEIPDVDALPFWFLDGIFNMVISKSEVITSKIPGGDLMAEATGLSTGKEAARQSGGSIVEKINSSTAKIDALNRKIKDSRKSKDKTEEVT